uniref:UBX domain-containing protein 4 n=1 Tax=Macrostomum lignano TaxID=282301 RepID=A0A1I8JMN2_9PLAT
MATAQGNIGFCFFEGSVDDAIKKVKESKTCLLVYVYGDDDTSKKYDSFFSSGGKLAEISSKFVCMRLAAQSDTALQFSAFYPVVSLPTIYLISADGISLEALIGDRSEEDIVERLSAAAGTVASGAAVGEASDSAAANWESRVAQMEQKIDARQTEKTQEAKERERQSELERRSVGRSLNQLRQQQQAEQERAWAEEVRQERMARYKEQQQKTRKPPQEQPQQPEEQQSSQQDATLRDFRESQSAAYREQRQAAEAARQAAEAAEEAAEREAAAAADLERRRTARLQLRCPDGRVFVRELPSSATLAELLDSVSAAAEVASSSLRGQQFRLATVYPRRVFNRQSESGCTLAELDLAPSASLLVLPPVDERGSGGTSGSGGAVASVLATPFILLSRLLALLLGFLGALLAAAVALQLRVRRHQQQRKAAGSEGRAVAAARLLNARATRPG